MIESGKQPHVYLAGRGVFRPDANAFGAHLKEKCARAGLVGCFPLDNELTAATPLQLAEATYLANVNLINSADAVIADISPFLVQATKRDATSVSFAERPLHYSR